SGWGGRGTGWRARGARCRESGIPASTVAGRRAEARAAEAQRAEAGGGRAGGMGAAAAERNLTMADRLAVHVGLKDPVRRRIRAHPDVAAADAHAARVL